jgi:hypothetical protein
MTGINAVCTLPIIVKYCTFSPECVILFLFKPLNIPPLKRARPFQFYRGLTLDKVTPPTAGQPQGILNTGSVQTALIWQVIARSAKRDAAISTKRETRLFI